MKIRSLVFITLCVFTAKAQTLQDGLLALDFERYEHARTIFSGLVAQEPVKGINYYYLGQSYWFLYKNDSAKLSYEKGISIDPKEPANYAGLGALMLEESKPSEAKLLFGKALGISRGKDGQVKDINALRFVGEAMVIGENKMLDSATMLIEQALEMNNKNYDVLIAAGDIYLEKNNGGLAATNYEHAISLDKTNPKAYTRVANIWLRVKNAEATNEQLKRAVEINPNYAPALKSYAEYYYQTGQFAKAKETYMKYLENSEPSAANKARFARILFRSKEYGEAVAQIEDILKSDQSDIYLYRLLGYSYYEVGNEKKDTSAFRSGLQAMEVFLKGIDPIKVLPNDYEYMGKLYSRVPGNDSLAIANINKAIEMDPTKVELNRDAAMIYNRLKKPDMAVTYFESYIAKATRVTAGDYQLLGISALNSKQFAKADSAFAMVNQLFPDYPDAYFYKASASYQLDPEAKDTLAKNAYEKYIALAEGSPDKYKKNLLTAYKYLRFYAIQKDDNATAKLYNEKVLIIDPEDKDAKEIQKLK